MRELKVTRKEYQKIYSNWSNAKKRGSSLPIEAFTDEPCDKIVVIKSISLPIETFTDEPCDKRVIIKNTRKSKASTFGLTQKEYRKAYSRWKAAIKKHPQVSLELFIANKVVKLAKFSNKPKNYYYQKRQLQQALATPKWVDIEEISEFYSNRPKGYHIDHIIPISGDKNVCGLHVLANLQYLNEAEHREKTRLEKKKRKI